MERVRLAVYDLSNGMAAQLSPLLLGKQLEAIYHSAVLLRGEEIYFGAGISRVRDGVSRFGSNRLRVLDLGETSKTREEVEGFLKRAAATSFSATSYNLLTRNCNHFSDEFATFLTGVSNCVPREIVSLPQEVLNSPFGEALRPMLSTFEASLAVREGEGITVAAAPSPSAALEAATGRAAVADARAAEARRAAPATAALPSLSEQERAVAADVAAAAAAVSAPAPPSSETLKAEFEALVRAEFDAVRSAAPALSANEAAAVALERAAAAVRGKA